MAEFIPKNPTDIDIKNTIYSLIQGKQEIHAPKIIDYIFTHFIHLISSASIIALIQNKHTIPSLKQLMSNHLQNICTISISINTFNDLIIFTKCQPNELMFISAIKSNNIPLVAHFLSNKFSPKEDYIYEYTFPTTHNFEILDLFIQYGLPITPRLCMYSEIINHHVQTPNAFPKEFTDIIKRLKKLEEEKNKEDTQKKDKLTRWSQFRKIKIFKSIRNINDLRKVFKTYTLLQLRQTLNDCSVIPNEICFEASFYNTDHAVIQYTYNTYNYVPTICHIMRIPDFTIQFYSICRFYPHLLITIFSLQNPYNSIQNLTLDTTLDTTLATKIKNVNIMYNNINQSPH